MSLRGLSLIAAILGSILGAVVYVGLDRLGHLEQWEAPGWKFQNQLLHVRPGSRVILNPINPDAIKARFMFERTVTEPVVRRDREPKPTDPPPMPYVLLWLETRRPQETQWHFASISFAILSQMGARSSQEWLEEIGPVRERLGDGSEKIMLRAVFGHQNGSHVAYFFDPNHPDPSALGFGWTRMEAHSPDQQSEINYAVPAGRYVPKR